MKNLGELREKIHLKDYPSPQRMLMVIASSIFIIEILIMLLFMYFPPLSPWTETLLDATLLTSVILPVLFIFFYRPFLRYINELKTAEENILKFATAIEQGLETILITDPAGKIIYINPAFTQTTGYTWAEAVGQTPKILKSGKQDAGYYKKLWETIASGEPWKGEFANRKKDGQVYYSRGRISPVKNAQGKIINYVAVEHDITNEKLAEAEREMYTHHVEELFQYNQNLIEKAPIGVWIIDFTDLTENDKQADPCYFWHEKIGVKIVTDRVNGKMAEMLGRTKEEMLGKSVFDPMIVDEKNAQLFLDEMIRRRSGNRGSYEITLKHKSGESVYVLTEAMPTATDRTTGKTIQSLGMLLDLTERKRSEQLREMLIEDLNVANDELKNFAYIVSHDLKAPLRAIGSLAEWLAKDYTEVLDDEGKENLALLLGRTKRMNNLIDGILRYSRAGRVKPEPDSLDSDRTARVVIEALSPPPNITVAIQGILPMVIYDRTHLEQIFQNLLGNAIKHLGKPRGTVTLSCRDSEHLWEFCVKDDGQGIEERHFDRIFKIFQSLKTRDELESTGIGLTLVKKLVGISGGTVWVKSTVGEGSEFHFTIPKTPEIRDGDTARLLAIEMEGIRR